MWSPAAENLMLGTIAAESDMGYFLKQSTGPALGITQVEPATHSDIMRYLAGRPDILARLLKAAEVPRLQESFLVCNLKYAVAIARIKYWMQPEPLPHHSDLHALATYHKKYYNSAEGAGTVDGFTDKYLRYVEGK